MAPASPSLLHNTTDSLLGEYTSVSKTVAVEVPGIDEDEVSDRNNWALPLLMILCELGLISATIGNSKCMFMS